MSGGEEEQMDNNNMYNQNNAQGGQQYSSYYETPGQPQIQTPVGKDWEEPVSMGEWLVSMLLMMIPCVNIVLMFVWAFSSSVPKSKSNYFKAALIMGAISIVLSIIMVIMMTAGMVSGLEGM